MKKKARIMKITVFIALILFIIAMIGSNIIAKEHKEAKSLPLNTIDFSNLKDGTYIGKYDGGMYQWRENKIEVTIKNGEITDIKLLSAAESGVNEKDIEYLFQQVIKKKSLQVDTISGATLTSKAFLQGVENALKKAEKK